MTVALQAGAGGGACRRIPNQCSSLRVCPRVSRRLLKNIMQARMAEREAALLAVKEAQWQVEELAEMRREDDLSHLKR